MSDQPELVTDLLAACAPWGDGKPAELVVEAMAGVMLALVLQAADAKGRPVILRRYAARIRGLARWLA